LLTQCPKCETIFRLGAADLGAAQGFVECGECAAQFSALDRLADEPKFSSSVKVVPVDHSTLPIEPSQRHGAATRPTFMLMDGESPSADFVLDRSAEIANPNSLPAFPEQASAESSAVESAALRDDSGTKPQRGERAIVGGTQKNEISATAALDANGIEQLAEVDEQKLDTQPPAELARDVDSPPTASLPESEHAILFTDPSAQDLDYSPLSDAALDLSDVPSVLRRDVAALDRPRSPLRGIWITMAVLFCLALMLQVAWILRAEILAKFPTADPSYKFVCTHLGCEYKTANLTTAIELVARDVRDHPQYINTLLVNATLVCHSRTANSYPVLELGLYGQTGEAIGIRRFEPREYLDKSIDPAAGMPPNQPVYIVLEIAGVDSRAVSFEFSFL
jgi:predicted Zn finger-like uncharacterized protein